MHAPTRRVRSRLVALVTAVAAALATVAVPATASPPDRGTQSGSSIDCVLDDALVSLSAFEFEFGAGLDVFVDTGDGSVFGFLEDATIDPTSVSGTVELIDESTGEVVGSATVDAQLTPSGPAESSSDRFRDGNTLVRFDDPVTPAAVTGSLQLTGVLDRTVDLATCEGRLFESTFLATNPASRIERVDSRSADCLVESPELFGFVSAFDEPRFGTFLDVFIDRVDGSTIAGATDDVVFDDTTLAGSVELVDISTGDPAGTATVDATLTSLGEFVDVVRSPRLGVRVTVEEFAVEGTLTVDGETLPLVGCFAIDAEGRVRFTDPPRRARPVANDLPGDALALDVPDADTVDTTGTVEEPEAPCVATFEFEDETGEIVVGEDALPIGHTVWYSFEGTGDPVTVDTAGSAIDTIAAVYTTDLEQLACVDDVFGEFGGSLQAAVTVDTEPGVTYLVRVGGFGFESGPVTVTTG